MPEIHSEWSLFSSEDALKFSPMQGQETKVRSRLPEGPMILVVDDQRLIADTLAEVLNRSGFRAMPVYDGESALDMALQLQPHYLLSDIMMPGMNGVDLAIAVQRQLPATLIVLISGQAGVSDILSEARNSGYRFSLLAKPIHPEKLVDYLKHKGPRHWK